MFCFGRTCGNLGSDTQTTEENYREVDKDRPLENIHALAVKWAHLILVGFLVLLWLFGFVSGWGAGGMGDGGD